jgi:uncharacterized repeat protein (TIGR01451 family)
VVEAIHAKGYVIGGLNENNILVNTLNMVTLIDCDSMQVQGGVQTPPCTVGKPEYTPPELQGANFSQIDRKPEHDNFGLAVLIFKMLMEGNHPYKGKWVGQGDPPSIQESIQHNYCPYIPLSTWQVKVPPLAPPISTLPPIVQSLIIRCFDRGHHNRPTASEWYQTLKQAGQSLTVCQQNPKHYYSDHLSNCPWCERKTLLNGRDPFPSISFLVKRMKQITEFFSLRWIKTSFRYFARLFLYTLICVVLGVLIIFNQVKMEKVEPKNYHIRMTAYSAVVQIGQTVTYTIVCNNPGNTPIDNVFFDYRVSPEGMIENVAITQKTAIINKDNSHVSFRVRILSPGKSVNTLAPSTGATVMVTIRVKEKGVGILESVASMQYESGGAHHSDSTNATIQITN